MSNAVILRGMIRPIIRPRQAQIGVSAPRRDLSRTRLHPAVVAGVAVDARLEEAVKVVPQAKGVWRSQASRPGVVAQPSKR